MTIRLHLLATALVLGIAPGGAALAAPAQPRPDFAATVDRHLAAVGARDLAGIEATITSGEALLLIFPDGTIQQRRDEFVAFHREWFTDTNWTMAFEKVLQAVNGDYGYALVKTSFDGDGAGPQPPRSAYLSLGFRIENGQWRLVHDQNTRIVETK